MYRVPELKFHLDVAHLFVSSGNGIETMKDLLEKVGNKLVHLHVHDNDGKDDQHLPIGAGRIDWEKVVKILKDAGYNDTITIELHSPEKDYFIVSRDKFKKLWMQL